MISLIIADDEISIRRGLERLVQSFELDIEVVGTAADGLQALTLVQQKQPQLMLVDINMPRLSGLDFIEKAREYAPESKIIIISGYGQFDYTRRALKLGVFDYLLKPINHGVLRSTLQDAIDSLNGGQQALGYTADPEDVIDIAIDQIHKRYADEHLRLSVLADELYISNASLSRGIKQRTGKTFSDYLTELRMKKAVELMTGSRSVMIYTVAEQVGYSSQHYFCRIFKEYTGSTPSEYIRKHREARRAQAAIEKKKEH